MSLSILGPSCQPKGQQRERNNRSMIPWARVGRARIGEEKSMTCHYVNRFLWSVALFLGSSPALADQPKGAPAFTKANAPILYQHCASCHRAGQIAPMSLLSYEEVRPWAASIREKVATGAMPPWHSAAPK